MIAEIPPPPSPPASPDIHHALHELESIRAELVAEHAAPHDLLDAVHPGFKESARNLLHYLALRRHDLRPLQHRLATLGLSSLGRAESHVLATVDSVLQALHHLAGIPWHPRPLHDSAILFEDGQRLLAEHTHDLFGPPIHGRGVRIMVTMPGEAAHDYTLVRDLLSQGMDCMRINCAHDDQQSWSLIINHLERARQALGRSCRVVMDLAGPKLRTGPVEPGPAVVRVRPQRDPLGRITAPARVWLTDQRHPSPPPSPADASLPLSHDWLQNLQPGDRIRFRDARHASRTLQIVDVTRQGAWAEADQTAYFIPGILLKLINRNLPRHLRSTPVGPLPHRENALSLHKGDSLLITRDLQPGRPASFDHAGRILTPAMIGCTIPDVFEHVRPGDAIWFDDGKIGGVVQQIHPTHALVRITHARAAGAKLQADKGINLPESPLQFSALTPRDLQDLEFAAHYADVVELSFANSARDVQLLQQHLARLSDRRPAIVLKIETERGFDHLPDMLLAAMSWPCCGVMIARGDLAVECGFERLAEVQEEILWICEAAHVPVIWATQVLESLAKQGMPSRAEITDAAMGHRAECVMLNKGPHILEAVRALDDILRRMQAHQAKKSAMLRELRLAHALPLKPPPPHSLPSDPSPSQPPPLPDNRLGHGTHAANPSRPQTP